MLPIVLIRALALPLLTRMTNELCSDLQANHLNFPWINIWCASWKRTPGRGTLRLHRDDHEGANKCADPLCSSALFAHLSTAFGKPARTIATTLRRTCFLLSLTMI